MIRSRNLELHIFSNNLVAFTANEFNFDESKSRGLHKKHAAATRNLGTISEFA
jgi:hypothetical protein